MNAPKIYDRYLTLYSADWWDDPGGFYPIHFTATEVEAALPARAQKTLRAAGAWPPPPEGLTLLGNGIVKVGDARADYVDPLPYLLSFDLPGMPAGTKFPRRRREID